MSGSAGTEYQRAADAIKSMITAGQIEVGALVKVPEIEKMTGTTYPTARVVAKRLEDAGILQAHPGKGFVVMAVPEEAHSKRADARELAQQVATLRAEVQSLAAQLERVESNVEDLYEKLGYEYETDGGGEPRNEPAPAARRGHAG